MDRVSERVSINSKLKDAIEYHSPDDEQYPKVPTEIVVETVVDAGHDRERAEHELGQMLRRGELYEVPGGKLGVV